MFVTSGWPREIALLERLAGGFERSPLQCNRRHESDAELIRIPGAGILALTTDAIVEEIETNLYSDPYLIGWMTVTVNASDLAAVGAEPVGLLLNQTLTPELSADDLSLLQRAIRDASAAYRLPVLGGDTNVGSRLHMAACALGVVNDGEPLTRRGAAPGDRLFASGRLGRGAAYALLKLERSAGEAVSYQPRARLAEGRLLRRFASACMDTSDGVIPTLDELARLNHVGFTLDRVVEQVLHPEALAVARRAGLPAWLLLAGPHGEFELVFTVPEDRVTAFVDAAARIGWQPVALGGVTAERGLRRSLGDEWRILDTRRVRDLYADVNGDVRRYVAALVALDRPATPS